MGPGLSYSKVCALLTKHVEVVSSLSLAMWNNHVSRSK